MSRPAPLLTPWPAGPDLSGHGCAADGCAAFGSFGFGPPRASAGAPRPRWYCRAHRGQGEAWWSGIVVASGAPAVERAGPGQGSLF